VAKAFQIEIVKRTLKVQVPRQYKRPIAFQRIRALSRVNGMPQLRGGRFHRRLLPAVARGGAYTFGGGKNSRAGSGRIFPRIVFKVWTRGDSG
jgi:hypothetical protein